MGDHHSSQRSSSCDPDLRGSFHQSGRLASSSVRGSFRGSLNKANSIFTVSAADRPVPSHISRALKSCLRDEFDNSSDDDNDEISSSCPHQVKFSHSRVRTYEVRRYLTSSMTPSNNCMFGLGWRYNPDEKVSSLEIDGEEGGQAMKRSPSCLKDSRCRDCMPHLAHI